MAIFLSIETPHEFESRFWSFSYLAQVGCKNSFAFKQSEMIAVRIDLKRSRFFLILVSLKTSYLKCCRLTIIQTSHFLNHQERGVLTPPPNRDNNKLQLMVRYQESVECTLIAILVRVILTRKDRNLWDPSVGQINLSKIHCIQLENVLIIHENSYIKNENMNIQ